MLLKCWKHYHTDTRIAKSIHDPKKICFQLREELWLNLTELAICQEKRLQYCQWGFSFFFLNEFSCCFLLQQHPLTILTNLMTPGPPQQRVRIPVYCDNTLPHSQSQFSSSFRSKFSATVFQFSFVSIDSSGLHAGLESFFSALFTFWTHPRSWNLAL